MNYDTIGTEGEPAQSTQLPNEVIQWEGPGWYAIRSHRDSNGEYYIHSKVRTSAKKDEPSLAAVDNRGTRRGNPWWYEEEPDFSSSITDSERPTGALPAETMPGIGE